MSACLKGHFHEGFLSTPKPLILIGKSKPVHYLPPFFFPVCMCACLCNIYWFGYSHKYDFPFFSVGKPVALKNLQGQIDGQTLRQMEMFNKFLHLVEGLRRMYLTRRLQPSLFLYMGKCSFLCENFLFTDTEQKQRSNTSHSHLRGSRVSSDGCNLNGKWAEFSSPSLDVQQDFQHQCSSIGEYVLHLIIIQ